MEGNIILEASYALVKKLRMISLTLLTICDWMVDEAPQTTHCCPCRQLYEVVDWYDWIAILDELGIEGFLNLVHKRKLEFLGR